MLAEIQLTLADYGVLAGIFAGTAGLPITILTILVSGHRAEQQTLSDRIDRVAHNKVDRTDWLRETISSRQKVDAMMTQIAEIGAKLDQQIAIVPALARLAEELKGLKGDAGD